MKFWSILLYIIIIIIIIIVMEANQVFKTISFYLEKFYHIFWQHRFTGPIVSWLQFYRGGNWQ